jgi:hypothetical protein
MTSDRDTQDPTPLRERLPAYVNGTASAAERKVIDDAVKIDPELRRELKALQDLAAACAEHESVSDAHADQLFARIKANIGAASVKKVTPAPLGHEHNSVRDAWWAWLFGNPRVAWGMALAQFAVLVVLAATNLAVPEKIYDVLSAPPATRATGARLNVVFDSGATHEEVNITLRRFGLRYVDGPSQTGTIVVALPDDAADAAQVAEELRRMRSVRFVEPMLGQTK